NAQTQPVCSAPPFQTVNTRSPAIQRRRPKGCSRQCARYETARCAERPDRERDLFREWRLLALRQTDLEEIERVPDQRVVADDRDHLDEAIFAERLDRLAKARLRQALGAED